jgi:hypothetical protein
MLYVAMMTEHQFKKCCLVKLGLLPWFKPTTFADITT